MAAFLASVAGAGAGAGILWVFVYGDNTWPAAANHALMAFTSLIFFTTLAGILLASYSFGKRREASGGLSRWHIALAIGISILLPSVVLVHQWQVGNFGAGTSVGEQFIQIEPAHQSIFLEQRK